MECMGSGNFGDSNLSFVQRLSSFQSSSVGLYWRFPASL